MGLGSFGEHLPEYKNRAFPGQNQERTNGALPLLAVDCEFGENERKMRIDMRNDAAEILEAAGMKDVQSFDRPAVPGMAIHEMGTARMGHDPKTSVLNKWNQMHDVKNVFVTDGAFHDFKRLPESIPDIHGLHCQGL
jgi:choline dehydrogenase-like flavoprotein